MTSDSAEYRYLASLRSGNQPVWHECSELAAEAAGVVASGGSKAAQVLQVAAPAVAAGASAAITVGRAPFKGVVAKVEYFPTAAITGAATNNRTLQAINGGQGGSGSTVAATIDLASGTNIAAQGAGVVTLSGTPANLAVNAGDLIQFNSQKNGSGIADPGGLVVVTLTRE